MIVCKDNVIRIKYTIRTEPPNGHRRSVKGVKRGIDIIIHVPQYIIHVMLNVKLGVVLGEGERTEFFFH